MVIFKCYNENKTGIHFESSISQDVIVKIIDGYTGLCSYKENMSIKEYLMYYFSHPVKIYHRIFEIWDSLDQNILLKIDCIVDEFLDLVDVDKFGNLKELNQIKNNLDVSVALPLYEIFVSNIYEKFFKVEDNDVVVDIGGNIGLFSYYAICKGASEVHCFEPSPKNYEIIKSNFKFNNLIIEELAVSALDGYVSFFDCESNSIGSSMYQNLEGSNHIMCKSVNLDTYISNKNLKKINYLKIDCEGAEYEIIENLDEEYLTNNIDKISLEYHFNRNGQLNKTIDKLIKCGFDVNFEFGKHQINDELGIIYAQKHSMRKFNFNEFIAPYKKHLEWSGPSRLLNYEYVINKLVSLNRPILVTETGTMWTNLDNNMGAFTLVFGDLIKNWTGGKLITIDISEKNINQCKETTKEFSDVIQYVCSDSVSFLESMSDEEVSRIDYAYFDSFDFYLPDPIPSQLHHFRELMGVYKRLSPNTIVSVDDNFLPNCWVEWNTYNEDGSVATRTRYETGLRILGKGTLVDCFLLNEGWKRKNEWLTSDSNLLTYERY